MPAIQPNFSKTLRKIPNPIIFRRNNNLPGLIDKSPFTVQAYHSHPLGLFPLVCRTQQQGACPCLPLHKFALSCAEPEIRFDLEPIEKAGGSGIYVGCAEQQLDADKLVIPYNRVCDQIGKFVQVVILIADVQYIRQDMQGRCVGIGTQILGLQVIKPLANSSQLRIGKHKRHVQCRTL